MPRHDVMVDLLDGFAVNFGSQYPSLRYSILLSSLHRKRGSVLLFNSIAAIASRFSTHPDIVNPCMPQYTYASPFFKQAKSLLGSALSIPCRDTVMSLVLLSAVSHGFSKLDALLKHKISLLRYTADNVSQILNRSSGCSLVWLVAWQRTLDCTWSVITTPAVKEVDRSELGYL